MSRQKKFSPDEEAQKKMSFLSALKASKGIIQTACDACGISRAMFKRWRDSDSDFKAKYDEVNEGQIDKVESKLLDWNNHKIDVLLAHPMSTAYGLNMQQGGHYIVWFGTGWNLELYQQANARLHRQGQRYPVQVYKLICAETVDERMDLALGSKKGVQQSLLDSLNYLERKHKIKITIKQNDNGEG